MSKLAATFLVSQAILSLGITNARADLTFCNDSKIPMYVSVLYVYEGEWTSDALRQLWPDQCRSFSYVDLSGGYFYYYARSYDYHFTWNGDEGPFCVPKLDKLGIKAEISEDQCESFGGDIESFVRIETDRNSSFTLGLTCNNECDLPAVDYDEDERELYLLDILEGKIYDHNVTLASYSSLYLTPGNNGVHVKAEFDFDLGDIQRELPSIIEDLGSYDECGDRVDIKNISLSNSGSMGMANLKLNVTYANWYCTYADLPQVRCQDKWVWTKGLKTKGVNCPTKCKTTWIKAGPLKTKGIPKCTTKCEETWIETPGFKTKVPDCKTWTKTVRTTKNRVLQQSGQLNVTIRPRVVDGKDVVFDFWVSNVKLSSLGEALTKILNIDVKGAAQEVFDAAFPADQMTFAAPDELRPYTRIDNVFFKQKGGNLWLTASGSFDVDSEGLVKLCNHYWPEGECALSE